VNPRPEFSVGEALVGLLESYGVDTIFGIPGVHNIEMYRALPRSNIRHILPRHEQGAGFMADGYARATGKPGVCFTISGPGVTNILTPMAQAWSDSSPILVISTALDVGDAAQGRGRLHEMIDQLGAAKSVTNLAMRAYTAKDVQDCVAKAFAHFASSRPRPAYIEIPIDVLKQPAGDGWHARNVPSRPQADNASLETAARKLSAARLPIIIAGGGALEAGKEIVQIAEATGAVIITTTAGKGCVPSNHSQLWGYYLGSPEAQKTIAKSDCVLAVGTELSETDVWTSDFLVTKNLIRIDLDPSSLARPHTAELAILGDSQPSLAKIAALISRTEKAYPLPAPARIFVGDAGKLAVSLSQALSAIRAALPRETLIASDMTQIAYRANEIFSVSHPRTWLHPVGFGTLGFALPAAIGAKFAVGKTPVACLVGDYGLQYTINELGTAAEHKLAIPILLWNNNALGQIRDNMIEHGIQPNAVTLRNPDFQMLARAYGCHAEKPASLHELAKAITAALQADGPTLIEMTPDMVT
jgi:5-guanidino-2-oxopentanoate decarboxylase